MPSVFANAASSAYDLAFQVSPIILVGGSYANSLGGAMPILGLVGQLAALGQGIITNGLSGNDFFARYLVEPGGTLINFTIGKYPFANQQVAANAVIQQPKNVSLRMICPVNDQAGYLTKLAIMTSLQVALEQHVNAGGMFNVATPAFLYTNGILIGMTDITSGTTNQKQIEYQLDFEFPLITQNQAQAALNTLMGKVDAGQPVTSPNWSGQFGSQGLFPGSTGLTGGVSQSDYVPSVIMQ